MPQKSFIICYSVKPVRRVATALPPSHAHSAKTTTGRRRTHIHFYLTQRGSIYVPMAFLQHNGATECSKDTATILTVWSDSIITLYCVQGTRYLWWQWFSACFVLKFAVQRGEGEKREGVQITKQSTQNLSPNTLSPTAYWQCQLNSRFCDFVLHKFLP